MADESTKLIAFLIVAVLFILFIIFVVIPAIQVAATDVNNFIHSSGFLILLIGLVLGIVLIVAVIEWVRSR